MTINQYALYNSPQYRAFIEEDEKGLGEVGELLVDKLEEETIELPSDHPFYDTDLLVFNDNYEGVLPLTGIRKTEFKEITELFQKICQGPSRKTVIEALTSKTRQHEEDFSNESDAELKSILDLFNFDIFRDEYKLVIHDDPIYQNIVKDSLKTLMTRRLGRKVITDAIKKKDIEKIKLKPPSGETRIGSSIRKCEIHNKNFELTFETNPEFDLITISNGKKAPLVSVVFITMAHEIIHTLNYPWKDELPTIADGGLDEMEEQMTIFGIDQPLKPVKSEDSILNSDEDLNFDSVEESGCTYNELNENNLRAVFGLMPRINHNGVYKRPASIKIQQKITPEQAKYFSSISRRGFLQEVNEFLEVNPDIKTVKIPKLFEVDKLMLNHALKGSVEGDSLECFLRLRAEGAKSPDAEDVIGNEEWHLCALAAQNGAVKILNHLLSQPQMKEQTHLKDEMDNNLLHLLLNCSDGKSYLDFVIKQQHGKLDVVQKLLDLGVNPMDMNKMQETPLSIAKAKNLAGIEDQLNQGIA